jgi:hypothetical protein
MFLLELRLTQPRVGWVAYQNATTFIANARRVRSVRRGAQYELLVVEPSMVSIEALILCLKDWAVVRQSCRAVGTTRLRSCLLDP